MKNACAVLAVMSLLLAAIPGRSQEAVTPAKAQTLQQRMDGWNRLRPVSQTEAMPAMETASPPTAAEAAPSPPHAGMAPVASLEAHCLMGPGHKPCWEQLDDWLTYRPLSQNCCNCFPKCAPCCPPPLYTFFIGNCCVNPAGPACVGRCGHGAPIDCRHCVASWWEGIHNAPLWPGNVSVSVRHHLSDMFFYLGKNCSPESAPVYETPAEQQN